MKCHVGSAAGSQSLCTLQRRAPGTAALQINQPHWAAGAFPSTGLPQLCWVSSVVLGVLSCAGCPQLLQLQRIWLVLRDGQKQSWMCSQGESRDSAATGGLLRLWWRLKVSHSVALLQKTHGCVWHMLVLSLQVLRSNQSSCQNRGMIIAGCTGWQDCFCLTSCLSPVTAPSQCLSGLVFHIFFNIISQLFQHECPNASGAVPHRMSEQWEM